MWKTSHTILLFHGHTDASVGILIGVHSVEFSDYRGQSFTQVIFQIYFTVTFDIKKGLYFFGKLLFLAMGK